MMTTTKKYSLYGFVISSEFPLPLDEIQQPGFDIEIFFDGYIEKSNKKVIKNLIRQWNKVEGGWLLSYENNLNDRLRIFINETGCQIRVQQSNPELTSSVFALINPVMAAVLYIKQRLAIHASSLVINGNSFLIAGQSGAGKSSLTAALSQKGMLHHSDDMAVPIELNSGLYIEAGYPLIKIHKDMATILGWSKEEWITIFNNQPNDPEKWVSPKSLSTPSFLKPARLHSIYMIAGRKPELKKPIIKALSPSMAVLELMPHIYGQNWLNHSGIERMNYCVAIASKAKLYKIWLPDGAQFLLQSADHIIDFLNVQIFD